MARNLKRENLKKLAAIKTENGFKVDLANYMYNPHLSYEYPSLVKTIEKTENKVDKQRVYYFKHYNGTGEYITETYTIMRNGNMWGIAQNVKETKIEESNRFNINRLVTLASNI